MLDTTARAQCELTISADGRSIGTYRPPPRRRTTPMGFIGSESSMLFISTGRGKRTHKAAESFVRTLP